jgi:hypothetical protein
MMISIFFVISPVARLRQRYASGCGVLIALLALLLVPISLVAQNTQGSITGRVTDSKGAALAGATVTITSDATKVRNSTKTSGAGEFNVLNLNPGTYTVTFNNAGFKELVTDNVIVSATATVQVDGALQVGGTTQVVTVTADAELLSVTADVSTTVDRQIVENLPYPERSSLEAVLLVPGVTGDTLNPGGIQPENPNYATNYFSPGASISIGGTPPGMSSIIVDGSDVTEASYPRAGLNLSGRVIQETTIVVAGASAQYGRSAGGVIAQSTRSGTSEYHGAVTWRHTDPWFNAYPLGTAAKNDQHETFLGGYFGGPVRIPKVYNGKARTFFYAAYEPTRMRTNLSFRGTLLTPAELSGQFHNSLDILNQTVLQKQGWAAALAAPRTGGVGYDAPHGGNTAAPLFPYGTIYTSNSSYQQINGPLSDCTAAGITQQDFAQGTTACHDDLSALLAANPFAQYVASMMPTPANPGPYTTFDSPDGASQSDLTNGTYQNGTINNDNRWSVRIDHQFNNSNNIYVRYTQVPLQAARFEAVSPANPLDQSPTDVEMGRDAAIGYTHVFTNNLVNSARYSFFREHLQRRPPFSASGTDYGAKFGLIPATLGYGFPNLGSFNSNGATYSIQPGNLTPSIQVDQNFIVGDDLSLTHGSHTMSFGFDYRWIQSNQYNLSGMTGGKYAFSSAQSQASNGQTTGAITGGGSAFGSFLEAIVSSYSNTPLVVPGYYRYKYWAAYFQDNWRATAKLTLNLGVRYEVQVPRTEAHDNQAFVSATPIAGTLNGMATNTAFCFSGACGLQRSLWPTNYWGIEPRVGFAYAATTKTVVRGSFAITRQPLSGQENVPDPDFNVSGSSAPTVSGYQTDYIANPTAASSLVSAYTQLNGARGPFNFSTGLAPVFVDQTTAVPYTEIWNLTVQHQPLPKTLVQVSYQGVNGVHLYGPFVALNTPSVASIQNAVAANTYLGANNPNTYGILTTNNVSGTVMNETSLQMLEPYQNFFNQSMTRIYPRNGVAHYNALYVSANQRATKNLTLLAYYTWSKSLDDVPDANSGTGAGSGHSAVQNPFDLRSEYAVSTFDQDSTFKAGYNLVMPLGIGQRFKTGNGMVDRLIGDISASGITTWITGFPNYVQLGGNGNFYSVVPHGVGGCTAKTGYCSTSILPSGYTLRPNFVPGVPLINPNWKQNPFNSVAGVTPYLNAAAFAVPGSIGNPMLGNVPRTLANARSPREFLMDMRVTKGITIRESYRLSINASFQNVFNHPVYFGISGRTPFSSPSISTTTGTATYNTSASFGDLSAGQTQGMSRVIRFGAEFTF